MSKGVFFSKYGMIGHGQGYYRKDENNKYYETYANIFEAISTNNQNVIKDMKEHFPNSYDFVLNDLKLIVE
jgi:hypothetical protein